MLPNLILGENAIPEYLDGDAQPETAGERAAAAAGRYATAAGAGGRLRPAEALMALDRGTPSSRAADIVLSAMRKTAEVVPA